MVAENKVAKRVKKVAKEYGLTAIRISMRPGVEVGWPDYLVLGPNSNMLGVETKATGKPASKIQAERARTMLGYGFCWCKPDSILGVDFVIHNFARHCIGEKPLTSEEYQALRGEMH